MPRILIAGGGIGGMVTALLLSKQGADVGLFEKKDRLGGRLAFQEGDGFRIDQGPTIVLLPEMLLGILEEAGIPRSAIPLQECSPMHVFHYDDGTKLTKWRDRDKQLEELERLSPGSSKDFLRYMDHMRDGFKLGKAAFLDRPFLRKSHFFTVSNLKLLARLRAYRSARSLAASFFKDERLIDAFSLQTLYIGGAPFQAPGLYTLLPYAEHDYGVWYVKGGYASLVPLLEKELRSRGVDIHTGTEVESLLLENGSCKGLIADSKEYRSDAVVYNGDMPHRLPHLSGNGSIVEAEKRSGKYVPSSGCVLVYAGTDKVWNDSAPHQFFLPPSLHDSLQDIFVKKKLTQQPSFYVFNPAAMDAEAAPPGQSVLYFLIPCPPEPYVNWEEETEALVEHVLDEAERRGFPGLKESIVWKSVRTPREASRDGLFLGGSFGLAPLLQQSAAFRPQFKHNKINGLYAVGASIHPGGGIPIVMQGARLLAHHLYEEVF
ncbi:phytoene desaturase family protein [Paenibacillus sp. CAU 1782]